MSEFVPEQFAPPCEAELDHYILHPLGPDDVEADCAAVNASWELIRRTRGGKWPKGPITVTEDLGDLEEHQRLFQAKEAFAYAILHQRTGAYAGCYYIYPPNHPLDDTSREGVTPAVDAVVSFWVVPEAYEAGLYTALFPFTENWLRTSWPFRNPLIVNVEKPAVS